MTSAKTLDPKRSWLFHPRELAVCGYSGSGKTTLLQSLLSLWEQDETTNYSIGYLKHDAHRFVMDYETKDTAKAWNAGSPHVMIRDPRHWAEIKRGELGLVEAKTRMLDNDFVFLEGYKNSKVDKILLLDGELKIIPPFLAGDFEKVQAVVGPFDEAPPEIPAHYPYFQRDNLDGIKKFIETYQTSKRPPVYGLVLTGGKSSRMGQDKALMSVADNGKSQTTRALELLSGLTDRAFVSSRQGQWQGTEIDSYSQIFDRFIGYGPMGGILSAMETHPEVAWLVVACDLPFLEESTIAELMEKRNPLRVATAYGSNQEGPCLGMPEPLCTIYEPKARIRLLEFLALGLHCPRKVLINSPIEILSLNVPNALENMNSPVDYSLALKQQKTNIGNSITGASPNE